MRKFRTGRHGLVIRAGFMRKDHQPAASQDAMTAFEGSRVPVSALEVRPNVRRAEYV